MIGADGVKSVVRAALFGPEEPRYSGYACWRGICPRPASVEPGYAAEWWGRGRRIGITTLPGDRVYWWAAFNAPAGSRPADEKSAVMDSFRGWADPVPELLASTPADRLVHNDIIDRPPTRTWSKGRVGLIGDAAHPTTPNLGQGGCMAIEDAVVLARAMAHLNDPERAFGAFTSERCKRTAAITNESWKFGKIGHWEGRLACRLRDAALGLVMPLVGTRNLMKFAEYDTGPLPI